MKGCIFDVWIFKSICISAGYIFSITSYIGKFWAWCKGWTINSFDSTSDCDGGEFRATKERIISNARHTVGDGDGGKARAIPERIISNTRHTIGNSDGGEARATRERIISNARHTIGNSDGGEARATRERRISNACYGENYNSLEIISLPRFEW